MAQHSHSIDEILASADLPELARGYVPDLKRRGREYVGRCPFHSERTGSFTIYRDNGRDQFKCFGCGAGGDAIDFVAQAEGLGKGEAIRRLAGEFAPTAEAVERARRLMAKERDDIRRARARKAALATAIFRAARPIAGTPAETYLRETRGIAIDRVEGWPLPSLRYIPGDDLARLEREYGWKKTDRYPAMVGGVQSADRKLVAAHLTFIEPDGSGKARTETTKRMIGPAYGGAVRFAKPARRLGIAEGIETGLSVAAALDNEVSVWAALSLQNIAGAGIGKGKRRDPDDPRYDGKRNNRLPSVVPDPDRPGILLPDECRYVYIFGDADGRDRPAGAALLDRAAARWNNTGRIVTVLVPPEGMDFNDLLDIGGMP